MLQLKIMHQRNVLAFKIITTIFSTRRGTQHNDDDDDECSSSSSRLIIHSHQKTQRRLSLCGFSLRKWRIIKPAAASAHAHGATRWIFVKPRFRIRFRTKKGRHAQEEAQLCNKRILMGEKCRPFNPSGVLHYDEQGILLPEDIVF